MSLMWRQRLFIFPAGMCEGIFLIHGSAADMCRKDSMRFAIASLIFRTVSDEITYYEDSPVKSLGNTVIRVYANDGFMRRELWKY